MMYSFFKSILQLLTWFVVVAPWEQAIRVRLGKRVRKLCRFFGLDADAAVKGRGTQFVKP